MKTLSLSQPAEGARRLIRNLSYRIRSAVFRPYLIRKQICEDEVTLEIDNLMSRDWYDRPHSWPELNWIKKNMLRPGMIIADCGAHTGLTACLFSKWVGAEGQVFAFEANPKNHKVLDRNIRNNNVENITSENLAVSKQEGVVIISDHGNSSISGASNKDGGVPVRSISLNDYFKNLEVYPNMIKVDVEGHEEEVLLGASEILKRGAALDLEIHSILFPANTRANKVARILALLPLSGRDCYIQPNVDGDILPYDPIVHTSSFIASFEVTHFFML